MPNKKEGSVYIQNVIDDTYNGAKYPIIEREYNAYYFPDNYNPDSIHAQAEGLMDAIKNHHQVKVWKAANPQ